MVSSITTDSRSAEKGDLFLALKGKRFDGHQYIDDVESKGVECVIVESLPESLESYSGAIIHVRDTLKALQNLAARYRRSMKEIFVIGVTGSNGKTTTKDFLHSVMSLLGGVNATKGNLNNHIGLPITILNTDRGHASGVWEMGMNHPGEIEILAEISAPDCGVITNIGNAHIEHMKTTEAIAMEKCAMAEAIDPKGYCVMPRSDPYYTFVKDRILCRMISVGFLDGDIRAGNIGKGAHGEATFNLEFGERDSYPVSLPVRGRHMVMNALLAAAVGLERGISGEDIAAVLSESKLTGGRLSEIEIKGVRFLDDTYNANPDSMRAALDVLVESTVTGSRIAVFGFMGELGDREKVEHESLGREVAARGIDILVTVGDIASAICESARQAGKQDAYSFADCEEASIFLNQNMKKGDLILVKGSRAAKMEEVFQNLETES